MISPHMCLWSGFTAALCKEIMLAHNTTLRTISFNDIILDPLLGSCRWIIDILSQITSHFIETVTLAIHSCDPQVISFLDPPALAALFEESAVFAKRSTRLQFEILGSTNAKVAVRAVIKESFRDLDAQGRLEFACYTSDSGF